MYKSFDTQALPLVRSLSLSLSFYLVAFSVVFTLTQRISSKFSLRFNHFERMPYLLNYIDFYNNFQNCKQ